MSARSPASQALHDGFDLHVLPVLEPLCFARMWRQGDEPLAPGGGSRWSSSPRSSLRPPISSRPPFPSWGPRIEAARRSAPWIGAPERARELWKSRNQRSAIDDQPLAGKFVFVGARVAIVQVGEQRFTFQFETARIDRTATPVLSGWWTTAAGTRQPSRLLVGPIALSFDPAGKLLDG